MTIQSATIDTPDTNTPTYLVPFNVFTETINAMAETASTMDFITKDGYGQGRAAIRQLVKLRGEIEARRLALKAEPIKIVKEIDGRAKELVTMVTCIEVPLKQKKFKVDEAEKARKDEKKRIEAERIARINARVEEIKNYPVKAAGMNSSAITVLINDLEGVVVFDLDEYSDHALQLKSIAHDQLQVMATSASQREQREKAQAEALRQQQEVAEQAALEAKKAADAAAAEIARMKEEAEKERKAHAHEERRLKELAEQRELERKQAERDAELRLENERRELRIQNGRVAKRHRQKAQELLEAEARKTLERNKAHAEEIARQQQEHQDMQNEIDKLKAEKEDAAADADRNRADESACGVELGYESGGETGADVNREPICTTNAAEDVGADCNTARGVFTAIRDAINRGEVTFTTEKVASIFSRYASSVVIATALCEGKLAQLE